MNCQQRILHNGLNRARTAALIASAVAPAQRTARIVPTARSGSAAVALSGDYTGAADATFDVQIVDSTPSVPIISAPQFSGVGNGSLSALTFSGAAQSFTVELVDAGDEAAYAMAALDGVKIVARAAGAAGNGIAITVTPSLTYTPLNRALIAPLPKETRRSDAVGLDFSAAIMAADGLFPSSSKRLVFGDDRTQVYRQAKQWTGQKWEYVFEPAIARYVDRGEQISEVTGSYSITIAQGAVTETHSGIVTLYDALVALNTASALVRVDGVIANDRAVNGQAIKEFSLRTAAYAQPASGNGSAWAQRARVSAVTVAGGAATEVIEARCWATSGAQHIGARLGHELWAVSSSLLGEIGNFATGDTIAAPDGSWSYRIEPQYPDGYGTPHGDFTVTAINMPRSGSVEPPPVCPVGLTLGTAANDQVITLTYTKRPSHACDCDALPVPDFSGNSCLFNDGAEGISMAYAAAIQTRMANLWAWRDTYVSTLTSDNRLTLLERERVASNIPDVVAMFEAAAVAIAGSSTALTLWDTAFTDLQTYALASLRYDDAINPSGTVTAQEAISAGSFVWIDDGKVWKAVGWVDGAFNVFRCNGYSAGAISNGATASASSLVLPDYVGGLSALTVGGKYVISTATPGVLMAASASDTPLGTALNASTLMVNRAAGAVYETTLRADDEIVARYRAKMDAVLAAGGVSPVKKADASAVGGDGCWHDIESEQYYWAVVGSVGGGYMPAFNNEPYISSRKVNGMIASTREFAFQINVKCPEQLKVGDQITLAIGNAVWSPTYQVGDAIVLNVIAAGPLTLAGGKNASLDQVWHVDGSVSGAFSPFTAAGGSGTYSNGGLGFTLASGGIRFGKGDAFRFSAEGGHWQWRKNGGGWSSPLNIGLTPVALSDGVSATISPGAAPSFVAGDTFSYAVRQPNAPGNVCVPDLPAWRWVGASATLDIDLGSPQPIDAIALARHTLPLATAGITINAGSAVGANDALAGASPTVHAGTIAWLADAPITARWVRISITGAADGAIGWVFVGAAWRPSLSADVGIRRDYAMDRGSGINPGAQYLGAGRSGSLSWTEGAMSEADYAAVCDMVDWLKGHADEPFALFPSPSRTTESLFARIADDQVDIGEVSSYQAASDAERRFHATIGLAGIIA